MPCCDTGRNIQKYKGAAASTLQDVTDNGNTTTGDIITTSGYFIGDGSKLTNVPGVSGAAFTLQQTTNKGNVTTDTVEFQNSITSLTASGNVLVTGNVTASVFYGDGSQLSGIQTATPTLASVVDEGNVTSNIVQFTNATTGIEITSNIDFVDKITLKSTSGTKSNLFVVNAIQLDPGPLPSPTTVPAAMTANSSGGNTASSGDSSVDAYKAFDGSDSTHYTSPLTYSTSSKGAYGATSYASSLGGVLGEWIKLQIPSAITPTSVFLKSRPDGTDSAGRPASWRILGSNDNTNWTQLHSSTTVVDDSSGTTESFTNTTSYSYLAFQVINLNSNYGKWTLSRLSFTDTSTLSPLNNVLSYNTTTGEIYDSGGQGGSSLWTASDSNIYFSNTVGIGTTSPAYKLDVTGDINFTGNLYQSGTLFSGGGSSPWTTLNSNIYYTSGSVGIGTTNPLYNLHVTGTSNFTNAIYANGSAGTSGQVLTTNGPGSAPTWTTVSGGTGSSYWTQTGSGSNIYYTLGNVGIGTMNPNYKLDVTGTSNFTGEMRVNGSVGTSGQVLTSSGAGSAPTWTTVSGGGGGSSYWTQSGLNIYYTTGNVGIANTAPTNTLDIGSNVSVIDDGVDKLVIRGNVYSTHDIIATSFRGDGSNLTGVTASSITSEASRTISISTVNVLSAAWLRT
jgi:hypothetical protein